MPERATLAGAFSRHAFRDVEPSLADDVRWTLVGGEVVVGKAAVMALCEQTARDLTDVTTTWESFRVLDAGASVVVESWATYAAREGDASRVASCDLYDFDDDLIVGITSFTVEV